MREIACRRREGEREKGIERVREEVRKRGKEKKRERERECVCVFQRERERERVCVCVSKGQGVWHPIHLRKEGCSIICYSNKEGCHHS